jgi:hypothetical protein
MRGFNTLISAIFVVAVMVFGYYATRDWALTQILWLKVHAGLRINDDNGGFFVVGTLFVAFFLWIGWRKYPWLTLLSAALALTSVDIAYSWNVLTSNTNAQGMEFPLMLVFGVGLIGMSSEAAAYDL